MHQPRHSSMAVGARPARGPAPALLGRAAHRRRRWSLGE